MHKRKKKKVESSIVKGKTKKIVTEYDDKDISCESDDEFDLDCFESFYFNS